MSKPTIVGKPKVIHIDRSVPFYPATFFGAGCGWTIEEQDERALALNKIDLNEVVLLTTLVYKEKLIKGEEKLYRLKQMNFMRLDAKVLKTLWDEQHLIPEKWKEQSKVGEPKLIFFDGTVLRGPSGRLYVLYMFWMNGEWNWGHRWLGFLWTANDPSLLYS